MFIDKISAFLGISSDRVRIVNIRKGSVYIDYLIDKDGLDGLYI